MRPARMCTSHGAGHARAGYAAIRNMVTFTLKAAGYEVVEAADGQEGLDKAKGRTVRRLKRLTRAALELP